MAAVKQLKLDGRSKYINYLRKDAFYYPNFFMKVVADLKKGMSPVVAVFGKPRTGKTLTAIFWAWILKNNFMKYPLADSIWTDVDKFIIDVDEKNIRGRALILDEAQKDLDIGAWNTLLGRALVKYNGSQAIRGNILFIIMPYARWLPWIQQPSLNYIITVSDNGNGWAAYKAFKVKADDFKGRSYAVLLENKRVPMIPQELLNQKNAWEIPAKDSILKDIRGGLHRKKGRSYEKIKSDKEDSQMVDLFKGKYDLGD